MILIEMVHDARMVPIGKPHAPQGVRKWMGDSVGRWEGDTFVIETTNFTNKTRFRGSTDKMKVTERLTRLDERQLLYQFTIEDPATWTTPWSGEYTWLKTRRAHLRIRLPRGELFVPGHHGWRTSARSGGRRETGF